MKNKIKPPNNKRNGELKITAPPKTIESPSKSLK